MTGFSSLAIHAATSKEIEALVNAGRSSEAYTLGTTAPRPPDDVLFDYYLGVAAVDSGRAEEGIKLFQSYLGLNPGDARARLELARGFFLVNRTDDAKREFLTVRQQDLPAEVIANINAYLSAIGDRELMAEKAAKPSFEGYVEVGLGHDSNVNGGVSSLDVTLPIIGTVTLDPSSGKASSFAQRYAAGVQGNYPLGQTVSAFVGLNIDRRDYSHQSTFNNQYATAQAGFAYAADRFGLRGSLNYNQFELGGNMYRTSPSALLEWQVALTNSGALFGSLQEGALQYTDSNEVRNAKFTNMGLGYKVSFDAPWKPIASITVNGGRERNTQGREDLSRTSIGSRMGLDFSPTAFLQVSTGYSWQASDYGAQDLFFGLTREDRVVGFDLSVTYQLTRKWSLRGELLVQHGKSNIDLFAYQRTTSILNLRYAW